MEIRKGLSKVEEEEAISRIKVTRRGKGYLKIKRFPRISSTFVKSK